MKISRAQYRASRKYNDAHYVRIAVNVSSETRDKLKSAADDLGISLNRLMVDGAEEYITNHRQNNGRYDVIDNRVL